MSARIEIEDDMGTSELEEKLIIEDDSVLSNISTSLQNLPPPSSGLSLNPLINSGLSGSTQYSGNVGFIQGPPMFIFDNQNRFNLFNPNNQHLPHYDESSILNNDEPIEVKPSTESPLLTENLVSVSLKSLVNKLKISSLPKEIPCVISVHGGKADIEIIEKNRQGLDLIFVVDVSGSMANGKLDLVKLTMEFVVTLLKDYDRMSIIVFSDEAYIVCPLTVMNQAGKDKVNSLIKDLATISGTNMEIGVRAAFHLLADRKYINQLTNVLMLSD